MPSCHVLVQSFRQRVQGVEVGHVDALLFRDLDGVADQGLDLEGLAGLDVGEHAAAGADGLGGAGVGVGACELVARLVLGDLGVAASLGDLDDLLHDVPDEVGAVFAGVGALKGAGGRDGGKDGGRVPGGGVDEHLAPAARLDVVVDEDGGAAALDQLHELAQLRRLSNRRRRKGADLEALEVAHAHDARRCLGSGQVDDARQDGVLREGGVPFVLDANAVLDQNDGGAWARDGRGDERRGAGLGVGEGLAADEDEVPGRVDGRGFDAVDDGRAHAQGLAEDVAVEGEAVLADVLVVAAAHAGDLGAGARQDPGVDGADGAGAEDEDAGHAGRGVGMVTGGRGSAGSGGLLMSWSREKKIRLDACQG